MFLHRLLERLRSKNHTIAEEPETDECHDDDEFNVPSCSRHTQFVVDHKSSKKKKAGPTRWNSVDTPMLWDHSPTSPTGSRAPSLDFVRAHTSRQSMVSLRSSTSTSSNLQYADDRRSIRVGWRHRCTGWDKSCVFVTMCASTASQSRHGGNGSPLRPCSRECEHMYSALCTRPLL